MLVSGHYWQALLEVGDPSSTTVPDDDGSKYRRTPHPKTRLKRSAASVFTSSSDIKTLSTG